MKRRIISFLLALALLVHCAPFLSVQAEAKDLTIDEIKTQVVDTYKGALRKAGVDKFHGYCGWLVNWTLVILGINASYVYGDGNVQFDNYKNLQESTGGYRITPYPASEYTLPGALYRITNDGKRNAYDILIGFEKTPSTAGQKYGHTCFIHAIIDGNVYFCESYNGSFGGKYYSEGNVVVCTIDEFAYHYRNNTLDGVIHFDKTDTRYLNECSELYPSYGETTAKKDCRIHTLPCNNKTAEKYGTTSPTLRILDEGEHITIHGIIRNTEKNYWYKASLNDGTEGYIFAENTAPMSQLWPYVEGDIVPDTISGSTFLGGSVKAEGSLIESVSAFVCKGTSDWGTRILSSDIDYVNTTNRYSLYQSKVDYSLPFKSLTEYGNGTYTIGIGVGVTNYYLDDNYNLDSISWCITAGADTFEFTGGSDTVRNYTVSFDAGGGENAPTEIVAQSGDIITVPSQIPTLWGSNFKGWSTTSDGEPVYQPGDEITVSSDLTLYAYWASHTNYFGPGGLKSNTIEYPGAGFWQDIVPDESGEYVIEGADELDTRATLYDSNGNFMVFDDDTAGNLQFRLECYLYEGERYYLFLEFYHENETGSLEWCITPKTGYRLSFDANGGEFAPWIFDVQQGDVITIPNEYPTLWGRNFLGWSLDPSAGWPDYYPGSDITVTGDTTLYAVWSEHIIDQPESLAPSFEILYPGQGYYIRIEPQETATYAIRGMDESDTRAILYDAYGNWLAECDDYDGRTQFYIEYDMVAGEQYYLWIGFYSQEETGYLDIQLEKKSGCTIAFDEDILGTVTVEPGTEYTIPDALPSSVGFNFDGWYCQQHECFYYPGDTILVDQNLTMDSWWSYDVIPVSDWISYGALIQYAGTGYYVALEPQQSGQYGMIGLDTLDTKAELYDVYGNLMASDDDSAGDMQFLISYYLNAGETYYLYISYYNWENTGTIPFHVGLECMITYNGNGGYNVPDPQLCYMGLQTVLSDQVPQLDGYYFMGWAFTDVASDGLFQPGQTIDGGNWNLRAIWGEHTCEYACYVIAEPSCTGCGEYYYECTICGNGYTEYPEPLGHQYEAYVVEPTCEEAGYTEYMCTRCWADCYIDSYVDPHGHAYSYSVYYEPATDSEGMLVGLCAYCGREDYVTLPMLNKTDYTFTVIQEPTTDSIGWAAFTWNNTDYGTFSFEVILDQLDPEPDENAATITVESVTGKPGDTVAVRVYLANNPGVAYAKLKLDYSSQLELISVENQGLLAGTFLTSQSADTKPYVLQWMGADDSYGDGCFVILTFKIAEDAQTGTYDIQLTCEEAYNSAYTSVSFQIENATVSVTNVIPGDLNGDGLVNGIDGILMAQYLAEWDVQIDLAAADVNGDGVVNGIDGILLAQYLAEWDVTLG